MKGFFSKYLTFSGVIFLVWLFLLIAKGLGFDFGINLLIFFGVFLILVLPLIIWETKKKWFQLWSRIKNRAFKVGKESGSVAKVFKRAKLFSKIKALVILFFAVISVGLTSLWRLFVKHVLKRKTALFISLLGIIFEIFILDSTSDSSTLFFTGLWVLSVWLYKFDPEVSIVGGLTFLLFCPPLLILKEEKIAERAGARAFMFLLVGVAQEFVSCMREKETEKMTIRKMIKGIKTADILDKLEVLMKRLDVLIGSNHNVKET